MKTRPFGLHHLAASNRIPVHALVSEFVRVRAQDHSLTKQQAAIKALGRSKLRFGASA